MKKIAKILFVLIVSLIFISNVSAKEREIYYTNDNGVTLTKEEYDFLGEMYWDGFQKVMTQEEYDFYNEGNYFGGTIEKKKVYDTPLTRGTFHSTANKSIQITKSCNTTCAISVYVEWINNPTIRSYDVIGAYLYNTSKIGSVNANSSTNEHTNVASITNIKTNGFGSSILLPAGNKVYVRQTFSVTKGGRIYASYQHAIRNTTLATSQQYDISVVGYGRVFDFYGDAANIYDNMNGVDIDV